MHNAIYDNQLKKANNGISNLFFGGTRMPLILDAHLLVTGTEHVFITGEPIAENEKQNFPWNSKVLLRIYWLIKENVM